LYVFNFSLHEKHQVIIPSVDDISTPKSLPATSSTNGSLHYNSPNVPLKSIEFPCSNLPRYYPAIVNYDHYIIFIGGSPQWNFLNPDCYTSCEVYDVRTNKWVNDNKKNVFPSLVFARTKARAVVANGTIIVLGGQLQSHNLVSVEVLLHIIPLTICGGAYFRSLGIDIKS
jgi:hypothetical protein